MGAGSIVVCPNGHGSVELTTTKCMAGGGIWHELACGCRNTGAHIQAGTSVSGTTVQTGKPNASGGWSNRDRNL